MMGCSVAWKCFVACLFFESSQHPTWPHVMHMRRWTHVSPVSRHSLHPRVPGWTSLTRSRCVHGTVLRLFHPSKVPRNCPGWHLPGQRVLPRPNSLTGPRSGFILPPWSHANSFSPPCTRRRTTPATTTFPPTRWTRSAVVSRSRARKLRGVASYYSLFSLRPRGRHMIRVCVSPICRMIGSMDLVEALEQDLGVEWGRRPLTAFSPSRKPSAWAAARRPRR